MKSIERLSKQSLHRRLKAIYALPQDTLTEAQLFERERIEKRLYEIYRERHPIMRTPPNFHEDKEEW